MRERASFADIHQKLSSLPLTPCQALRGVVLQRHESGHQRPCCPSHHRPYLCPSASLRRPCWRRPQPSCFRFFAVRVSMRRASHRHRRSTSDSYFLNSSSFFSRYSSISFCASDFASFTFFVLSEQWVSVIVSHAGLQRFGIHSLALSIY